MESFAEREARLDATIWKDEMTALRHEKVFVNLRDALRHQTNKLTVLSDFRFVEMDAPKPVLTNESLGLGITLQRFTDSNRLLLLYHEWQETLTRLATSGWMIAQGEWTHEKFVPATRDNVANSEFRFELHGARAAGATRFIVSGTLSVKWGGSNSSPELPAAGRLTISNLTVLERTGPPGFTKTSILTPSPPEKRGQIVDLAPVIVTDVNADGSEDVIVAGINKVFLNKGDASFNPVDFVDESKFHGSQVTGVLGDFNGDGFPDFLTVASQGTWSNKLVLHVGDGRLPFSAEPRVACDTINIVSPGAITVGDVDEDGDLDVWIGQYKQPYSDGQMPTPYYDAKDGHPSFLLLNDGNGHFADVTAKSGLAAKSNRRVISATLADLNNDGHMDLLTANDFCGVDLFYNDGHGQFHDETSLLYNRHLFGMAISLGDFDRDGTLDFFVAGMSIPTVRRLEAMRLGRSDMPDRTSNRVDMTYGNRIYTERQGKWIRPPFSDLLAESGWTWGSAACDFDNDGNLDLYLANGNISGESVEDYDSHYWRHDIYLGNSQPNRDLLIYFAKQFENVNALRTSYNGHQHNILFMDFGQNKYANIAYLMNVASEADCRTVIAADLDNDGRPDLLFTENEHFGSQDMGRNRLHIYRNVMPGNNHWIGVKLPWRKDGVSPFGAKVIAKTPTRTYVTQLSMGTSYRAQFPNSTTFGLGQAASVTELIVRWPQGQEQVIKNPALDRYHSF